MSLTLDRHDIWQLPKVSSAFKLSLHIDYHWNGIYVCFPESALHFGHYLGQVGQGKGQEEVMT